MDNKDTILIVDDDEYLRQAIETILQNEGYLTIVAENGLAALSVLKNHTPDLVLLDLMMPGISGLQTCEKIRNIPGMQSTPIIILTQLSDTDSISEAFSLGVTDFLTKPLNWVLLIQRIKYTIHSSKLNHALEAKEDELDQAQRVAKLGTFKINLAENNIELSKLCAEILLHNPDENPLSLPRFSSFVTPNDYAHFEFTIEQAIKDRSFYIMEFGIATQDGEEKVVAMQGEYHPADGITEESAESGYFIGTIQDVTESRLARENLEYQRFYDPLTELLNRKSFELQTRHYLLNPPVDSLFAVVFIGLDHFSHVNDNLGHAGGDIALRQIASRLRGYEEQGYIISRFGGDVFALLIKGLSHIDESDNILNEILHSIRMPMTIKSHQIFITASIGASIFPIESEDSIELIKGAEAAMLHSRQNGGNRYTYRTADMNKQAKLRAKMERDLRSGLENNEFVTYYQPQVDAATLSIIGMEALVRWQHKLNGIVSPADFIPLAEESGLIVPIGERVLQDACDDTKKWLDKGFELIVGINLSAQQFEEKRLLEVVTDILADSKLDASKLELEITESMAIRNLSSSVETLKKIRNIGIKTSMDDFGTGYSSLSQLQQLPLDTLKIDQVFIRPITYNPSSHEYENVAIASAVIAMAHSLGLKVIAEGVETYEQCEFLRKQGCDILQGHLFGRPMTAGDFEKNLLNGRSQKSKLQLSQYPLHS